MWTAQAPASHHRLRNKCDLNSPASTRRPRRFHTSLACSTPAILPSVHPHRPHVCYSPPPGPASSRGTKHLGQPHRRLATACDNVSTASQPSALVPAHTKQRRCVDSNDAPQKKAPHRAVCTPQRRVWSARLRSREVASPRRLSHRQTQASHVDALDRHGHTPAPSPVLFSPPDIPAQHVQCPDCQRLCADRQLALQRLR
jgi:hypothetical protein